MKDFLFTSSMIGLIMLAIIGTFFTVMDRPMMDSGPIVSLVDQR